MFLPSITIAILRLFSPVTKQNKQKDKHSMQETNKHKWFKVFKICDFAYIYIYTYR